MIEIYTDASVAKGKAVATCFIISTDYFIGYDSFEYIGVNSSLHGELLGIRDGLKYACKLVRMNEPITVYCDSNSALDLIKTRNHKRDSKSSTQFKTIVSEIQEICKEHFVNFLLIKGHQTGHNPNKVVDLVSNTLLRYSLNERSCK